MNPLISVLVPVYNVAAWLPRCLDSICSQTYANLEILCVNDGSTDNSAEILEAYAAKDSRIKVINQQNGGLSAARNTALEYATGEWVTGVDSDDYIALDLYTGAVEKIDKEVDAVFWGVQMVDEEGEAIPDLMGYFDLPMQGMAFSESLALKLNACFWSKLWRRSVLVDNSVRFPEGLVHEDEVFYCLCAPHLRNVAFCPSVGYYYVQRKNSIMHSGSTALDTAQKYVKAARYIKEHISFQYESYFFSTVWRLYKQCFHFTPRPDRLALVSVFRQLLSPDVPLKDYRVECLLRDSSRWLRYEPQR